MQMRVDNTNIFAFLMPIVCSAAMIVLADSNSSKLAQRKIAQNIPLLGRHNEDRYEEIYSIVEGF